MAGPAGSLSQIDTAGPSLVGRAREQALLRERLAAAITGRGSLILVGGEAGVGKTALAEALCQEAGAQGVLALVGRCYDLTETPPYGPWAEVFGQVPPGPDVPPLPLAGGASDLTPRATSQAALYTEVYDFLRRLAARRPLLLLLDDLHWADQASLDLLRSLARQLATVPALLLVTYRADELTRRHPLYQLLPTLVREAQATRLALRPLDDAAARALVATRYALPDPETNRLAAYLQERGEGNPFFLSELLQALEEAGVLAPLDGGWALGDLGQVRVPMLLRQVIDARVARLGDEAQRLLAVAAIIGQEVPLDVWATVGGVPGDALLAVVEAAQEARLLEETPDGARARFVHALIREALYEGVLPSRRRAWHRAVGEALAAQPTPASGSPDPDLVAHHFRQAGDPRAAEWLVRAGQRAQRAYAWLTAAERFEAALGLMESSGTGDAERGWLLYHLGRLLRMADPGQGVAYLEESLRRAEQPDDRTLAAYALFDLGHLHCLVGDARRGLGEMEAGLAALDALPAGDHASADWVAQAPHPADHRDRRQAPADDRAGPSPQVDERRSELMRRLALVGRYAEALALGEWYLARAAGETTDEQIDLTRATVHEGLAIAYAGLGRPDEARQHFARARAGYRASGHHVGVMTTTGYELEQVLLPYQADQVAERERMVAIWREALARASGVYSASAPGPSIGALGRLSLLRLEGDLAEAREGALAVRAGGGTSVTQLWAMGILGPAARDLGDADLAWAQVRDALPLGPATEPGGDVFVGLLTLQRLAVDLALDADDLPTARQWLDAHDRWLAWSEAVLGRAAGQLLWAMYHRAAGDLDLAHEHAERALAHATEPRQPLDLLAAHRLLGELDTQAGRHAEAATHLEQAFGLADACRAPHERALTLLALAELRAVTGLRAETQVALDEARAICVRLGAQPALARADALAARIAAAPPPRAIYPAGLTAREVEVLRLVAEGLTDAQVAERLYLSPRTVTTHLTSIYTKLGVSTRMAAARFATEHQLA